MAHKLRNRLACLLVMTLFGCDGSPAPIDLTIVAGPSLSSADLARIRFLDFTVSGAEAAQARYPLSTPFADHRQERVAYATRKSSGSALFSVDARDGNSTLIANGQAQISLGSGAPRPLTLEIDLPVVIGDGGVSDGAVDLSIPDLAGVCGGQPDGAGCGVANACNSIPTCLGGVCIAHPLADGTACGAADSCHSAPTCAGGTCTPHPLTDGTVCAPGNSCQNSGTCTGGVCGAITNKGAGTVCSPAANACHTNGTCDGNGNCGAQGVQPEGFNYAAGYLNRCCSGVPTQINTAANCGACGINCGGLGCLSAYGQYYCGACTANAQCWTGCCATLYTGPQVCVPGNCSTGVCSNANCPGNAACVSGLLSTNQPGYCHY